MRSTTRQHGFTLVELIMVIIIIGVIGGMVAVFMKGPIDAYIDSGRRAALTDVADTVVRRMARDLQGALPNSIRPGPAGTNCLEFIPTKTGGRYRATGAGSLDFAAGSSSFNMLGDNATPPIPADQLIALNDVIVVYNLGFAPADAYTGTNWETVNAAPTVSGTPPETTISLSSTKVFPLESGSRRFHVVPGAERMVSYVCSGSSLRRTASAAFTSTASCPVGGPVIANNVNCAAASTWFNYAGNDNLQRNAVVSMGLTISDSSGTESITLQHEVHVSNTP
nr:prepilin-type N-terminal cleavage/methylation domain-containing protein [Rhodoferax sp.]